MIRYLLLDMCKFQFHKVQLREITSTAAGETTKFQFHKVQLRVSYLILNMILIVISIP